jgi:hypothetical protein
LLKLTCSAPLPIGLGRFSIAAKFPSLGQHRIAIARAHNAIQSPAFYRAIGQDPAALVQAGIQALQERYKL